MKRGFSQVWECHRGLANKQLKDEGLAEDINGSMTSGVAHRKQSSHAEGGVNACEGTNEGCVTSSCYCQWACHVCLDRRISGPAV